MSVSFVIYFNNGNEYFNKTNGVERRNMKIGKLTPFSLYFAFNSVISWMWTHSKDFSQQSIYVISHQKLAIRYKKENRMMVSFCKVVRSNAVSKLLIYTYLYILILYVNIQTALQRNRHIEFSIYKNISSKRRTVIALHDRQFILVI